MLNLWVYIFIKIRKLEFELYNNKYIFINWPYMTQILQIQNLEINYTYHGFQFGSNNWDA